MKKEKNTIKKSYFFNPNFALELNDCRETLQEKGPNANRLWRGLTPIVATNCDVSALRADFALAKSGFKEAERIEKNRFYAYFAYPCIPAFKAYLLLLLEKLDLRFVFLDMAGLFRGAAIPVCIIHTGQYRVKGKIILDKKGI